MSLLNQIESHNLYTYINTCFESLSVLENDENFLTSLNENGIQTINRCRAVFSHLKHRVDSVDPFLVRRYVLDAIYTEITHIGSMLQNYTSYLSQQSNLDNINGRLENILSNLIAIPQLVNSDSIEDVRETVISFRRAIGQHKKILETQQETLSNKTDFITEKIDDFTSSYEDLIVKMESTENEFRTKFTEYHDTLIQNEELRLEQFEEKLNLFQAEFEEKLVLFAEEMFEVRENNQTVLKELVAQFEKHHQEFLNITQQKQADYDSILEEHKKSVEALVGIISTNSISGHFKEVADKKEKLTTKWQRTTIGGFLLTIGFGIYAFIISDKIDWPSLVARFIVTSALGAFTAYAARQAAKNDKEEQFNRKMEVELKTLNPYIASFTEDDQIKLKEQLFPQIFGRASVVDPNHQATTPGNLSNPIQLNSQDTTTISNAIEILKNLTSGSNKGV